MRTIKVKKIEEKEVSILSVSVEPRYWEDSTVNGIEDEGGLLIPCREEDLWCPEINLETGVILNWKQGIKANIHYKVCDAGEYILINKYGVPIKEIEGYVPSIMCPENGGYGDYIIMNIDENGQIENWDNSDLSEFEEEDED